jgi:hypothetical protein
MMTGFMLAIVLPYRPLRAHGRTVDDRAQYPGYALPGRRYDRVREVIPQG